MPNEPKTEETVSGLAESRSLKSILSAFLKGVRHKYVVAAATFFAAIVTIYINSVFSIVSNVGQICDSKTLGKRFENLCSKLNSELRDEKSLRDHSERAVLLNNALSEWRLHGVRANQKSLNVLQSVTDEDANLFTAHEEAAWDEIVTARDVLNAPGIGLSGKTINRLTIFVKSSDNSELSIMFTKKLSEMFENAGFKTAKTETRAAIIFYIENFLFDDIDDGINSIEVHYRKRATLTYKIIYNASKQIIVKDIAEIGEESGNYNHLPADVSACALLKAGYAAVEKFIASIDKTRRPFQQRCF